ncbi:MAG: Crp/Fnr family transcriptional regulator, partial [Clostridia bacterium]|nr:Crp/Fnr family transcriptional regulator [Clostridia bacterium]
MEQQVLTLLEKSILFRGCKLEKISSLLKEVSSYRENFSLGEKVFTKKGEIGRVGILLNGSLAVFSAEENGTPLNTLKEGDLFGVSVLFGNIGAPTLIKAKTCAEVLFIDEEKMEPLWENSLIRKNLVSFLTDRICFLNKKISAFTAGSTEGKFARFLLQNV